MDELEAKKWLNLRCNEYLGESSRSWFYVIEFSEDTNLVIFWLDETSLGSRH